MKKLLSLVLALAIVISCFTLITIAGETEPDFKGAKFTELDLTSRGTYFCSWNPNVFWKAADVTDDKDGTFGYKYTIYNIGTEAMKAQLSFNTVTYSPTNVPNTKYPDATVMPNAITEVKTIEPGESADLEISIAANNGWVTYVIKGTTDQAERTYSMPLNYVAVRLDLATISGNNAARKFVIESKGCDGVDYFVDAYTSQKWQKEVATRADLPAPNAGIKAEVTNDAANNSGLLVFAKSSSGAIFEDDSTFTGKKTISYTVYNTSDADLNATLYVCTVGNYQTHNPKSVTIPANSKAVLENTFNVENGMVNVSGTEYSLSQIRPRFNLNFKNLTNGDIYYIEPTVANANDPIYAGASSNNGFTLTTVKELPNVDFMATPEPTIEPTEEPTPVTSPETSPVTSPEATKAPVGIKYSVKADQATGAVSVNDYGNSPWASDASFTGQKKLNYVVYNTSTKEVKVTLYITMMSGGITKNGDAETIGTVTLPAGYKGDLSAYVNVEDGTVKMKADDSLNGALNTIRLRFTLEFTGGAKIGDSVIIAPADGNSEDFVIKKFAAGGVDKEVVYQLPEDALTLATPKTPIGIQFIAKEDKATGSIGVNDYNNSPWDADPSFTGQKKLDYIVYNTSNKTVTVEFFITVLLDLTDDGEKNSTTHSGDAETYTKVTLPAGYKGELSALVNVENGIAKLKADGSLNGALNLIRLRFTLAFEGGATKEKDSVIIVPADGNMEDFVMTKFVAGGVDKALAYEFPPEPKKPVGIALTAPEDKDVPYFITSEGIFKADSTFTGKKEITYTIYNDTSTILNVTASLQIKDNGWWGPSGSAVSIAAGKKAEVKASIDVVNGKVTVKEKEYDLEKVFLRFNFKDASLKKGDKIYIVANEELDIIYSTPIATSGMTVETVYELPAVRIPVGIKVTAVDELDGSGNLYVATSNGGGIASMADVKNGIVTKTFKIKNHSDAIIEVKLDLQVFVSNSWKSPAGKKCDWVVIEPGKTAEVTCTATCEDGKVKVEETEYDVSKLLAKLSFRGEDGTIPEKTSFTIYASEADIDLLCGAFSNKDRWATELIYSASGAGTGDVLPVAIMATVALAFVTLVVVSKKRKED